MFLSASASAFGCVHSCVFVWSIWRNGFYTRLAGGSLDDTAVACEMDTGTVARLVRRVDECGRQLSVAWRILGKTLSAEGLSCALTSSLRRGEPFCESLLFPRELRGVCDERLDRLQSTRNNGDPWESEHAAGSVVFLDPREVGFSHDTISRKFQPGTHELANSSILKTAWELHRGERCVLEMATSCRVVFYHGTAYTLGNRRLAALRMFTWMRQEHNKMSKELPFVVASHEEALEWGWTRKFTTGCFRGVRTVVRETGEVLGQEVQDSLVSLAEDTDDWYSQQQHGTGSFWDQYELLPASVREPEDVTQEELTAPQVCYSCGLPGHMARDCFRARQRAPWVGRKGFDGSAACAPLPLAQSVPGNTDDNFPTLAPQPRSQISKVWKKAPPSKVEAQQRGGTPTVLTEHHEDCCGPSATSVISCGHHTTRLHPDTTQTPSTWTRDHPRRVLFCHSPILLHNREYDVEPSGMAGCGRKSQGRGGKKRKSDMKEKGVGPRAAG